jgi:aryl-alcohol dehydrogenase-like predicted oxidoreductase
LGRTNLELSVVSVGGWLGMVEARPDEAGPARLGGVTPDEAAREAAAIAAVQHAVALGINYFDTAPMYSQGAAETALGD